MKSKYFTGIFITLILIAFMLAIALNFNITPKDTGDDMNVIEKINENRLTSCVKANWFEKLLKENRNIEFEKDSTETLVIDCSKSNRCADILVSGEYPEIKEKFYSINYKSDKIDKIELRKDSIYFCMPNLIIYNVVEKSKKYE